jgi:hypothetical protein
LVIAGKTGRRDPVAHSRVHAASFRPTPSHQRYGHIPVAHAEDSLSYDFYILLRIVVCAVAAHTAWLAYRSQHKLWLCLLAALALLFNPIAPFYFSRETWQVLDVVAAAVLVLSIFFVTVDRPKQQV